MPEEIDKQNPKDEEELKAQPTDELDETELSAISGGTHTIVSPRDAASGLPTGKRK